MHLQRTFAADRGAWTGFLLNSAAARFRRSTAMALAPLGLSPPMLRALETLEACGKISQSALGERMMMDRSSVVLLVDQLEALALVSRTRDQADRRNQLLELLPAAAAMLAQARIAARAVENDLLSPLTPAERDRLRELLAKILNPPRSEGLPE